MPTTRAQDGTELYFADQGDGPPVVLVHGITESHESWAPVTERVAATHRVIAVDLRGHGRSGHAATYDLASMAGDVVAVAQAAGAERPHVVGHSLGGAVESAVGATGMAASATCVDLGDASVVGYLTPSLRNTAGMVRPMIERSPRRVHSSA